MASMASAGFALTNSVHADGRYVMAPATEQLRNFDDVQRELVEYMRLGVLYVDNCPLEWWRQHKQFMPGLAAIARSFLCVPATSAAAERFFSTFGLTISRLRTRLSSETVQQLLFCKLNWDDAFYHVRIPSRARADGDREEEVMIIEDEAGEGQTEQEQEEQEDGALGEDDSEESEGAFNALSLLGLAVDIGQDNTGSAEGNTASAEPATGETN